MLTEQGERGDDIYLLLDRVLTVWVDGIQVGELGPGAVVGERAVLEMAAGPPPCALSPAASSPPPERTPSDRDSLASLAEPHHQEDPDSQEAQPRPQPRA